MNHNRPIIFLLLLLHPWTATAQQSPTSPTNNSNIDPYANSDFNQSIVIVLVLIGSSFFIVIFYTIIRQFAGDRNGDAVNRGTGGFRSQRINRGIEASALEAFPTFLYSDVKGLKLGNDTLVCAICINEFEDDKTLRLLPKCDHVFHTDCIDTWLATHTTCPVCRSNLVPDPPRIIPPAAVEESADHVAVRIEEEVVDPTPSSSLLLPLKRNWSGSTRRFPRSHSTGHSVVAPGENCVRFTLRLPEHVRREIFVGGRFHQSKSLLSSPTEESSRRGCRSGGGGGPEGSNRGGSGGLKSLRLGRSRSRSVSFLSPRMTAAAMKGSGEGSVKGEGGSQRGVFRAPFNCRCGGGANDEWLIARLNPPV